MWLRKKTNEPDGRIVNCFYLPWVPFDPHIFPTSLCGHPVQLHYLICNQIFAIAFLVSETISSSYLLFLPLSAPAGRWPLPLVLPIDRSWYIWADQYEQYWNFPYIGPSKKIMEARLIEWNIIGFPVKVIDLCRMVVGASRLLLARFSLQHPLLFESCRLSSVSNW